MIKNLAFPLVLILSSCANSQEHPMELTGKIAIILVNSYKEEPQVYFPATGKTVFFNSPTGVLRDGLSWVNRDSTFVGIEYAINKDGKITHGNVVRLSKNIEVIDTIYRAAKNELTGDAFLSRNDSKLLFTTESSVYDPSTPLKQLNRPITIKVLDFKTRVLVKNIENVGSSLAISFHESPWFRDENRFIYDINGDRRIVVNGKSIDQDVSRPGIYLYNLKTDEHQLLVDGARYGVVSPTSDKIAYLKEKQIWIYDLTDKSKRPIFTPPANEKVTHIHWTPDGGKIYLTIYKEGILESFENIEKLIDAENGEDISFKKIGHGFGNYTWK